MNWLDLLAVQVTLKSLFQHHSSKASILWRSAFFTVQLSHPYMTTGKIIALTRQTLVSRVVSRVMSLLLNMLSSFFAVEAMEEPSAWGTVTWISLSGIQIGESASCGKIQAHPRPLVNNGSGHLHCLERKSFHFTNGLCLVVLDTSDEALQCFWTNLHLNYLLQR